MIPDWSRFGCVHAVDPATCPDCCEARAARWLAEGPVRRRERGDVAGEARWLFVTYGADSLEHLHEARLRRWPHEATFDLTPAEWRALRLGMVRTHLGLVGVRSTTEATQERLALGA